MGAEESCLKAEKSGVHSDYVRFTINGKEHTVKTKYDDFGSDSRLVDYIRDEAGLKGTKVMCREGGCGACVVNVKSKDMNTGKLTQRAVNSCLTPLFSCDGWEISTIEGLGNRKDGYHPIQQRLVKFGGTQCGFCSPGMCMNMHGLLNSKKGNLKAKDVEDNFDGNICRCTGYRSILDAFKSFAGDVSDEIKQKCQELDIEDMKPCLNGVKGVEEENVVQNPPALILNLKSGSRWVRPTNMASLFEAIKKGKSSGNKLRIVAGNTGTGVYKDDASSANFFIDITRIPELSKIDVVPNSINLGAGVTLAETIKVLKKTAASVSSFQYTLGISKHLQRVANAPVRNAATIGGNLMLKHAHKDFESDVFLLLATVGAEIKIATDAKNDKTMTISDFLNYDMENKVILSIQLNPVNTPGCIFRTFKVGKRNQNSHAFVNAGFFFRIDSEKNFSVLDQPKIIYGGINEKFVHASETEKYFVGKPLHDTGVLKEAMVILEKELKVEVSQGPPSADFKKTLAQSLLYKFILGALGGTSGPKYITGARNLKYPVTSGKQTYDTDKKDWPINKPVPKLESIAQVSGEAEYINDIHAQKDELVGMFVLSDVANADLKSIDAKDALNLPGVVAFIQAKDIPGVNNYMIAFAGQTPETEEVFCSGKIVHGGQPLGLIVAESREIAIVGVKLVKVTYENVQKPILTIKGAMEKAEREGKTSELYFDPEKSATAAGTSVRTISGEFNVGGQYHFQMETHICLCIPTEDGLNVYPATQYMDQIQQSIAQVLNMQNNQLNIQVRRLGGSYGSKISRAAQIASACALAAKLTNRPVRLALDLHTNMETMGKRSPYYAKYEAGVDNDGKIMNLKTEILTNCGIHSNEETGKDALGFLQNCYKAIGWDVTPGKTITNTAANTWCRAPGTTQGVAIIENIMEHIAFNLGKDPIEVRKANLLNKDDPLFPAAGDPPAKYQETNMFPKLYEQMNSNAEFEKRKTDVESFNLNNRWKKRGISLVPLRYPLPFYNYLKYHTYIAIYKSDGTVAVSTGGIEMGQGLNTKVAQAVAYRLSVPLEKVVVKPSNNLIGGNDDCTGGSMGSELCVFAALKACDILLERLKPIKEKNSDASWENLVAIAAGGQMDLTASFMVNSGGSELPVPYDIWAMIATEVEIDVLTGEHKTLRVDLIEDAGKSLNPEVDIGQIEGAFVMGTGLWTLEKLIYDENTGKLLTNGTWEYKPPEPRDIPQDFRITLLKDAPNPYGVLRSKATGEPPLNLSVSVLFAIRNAIMSARKDAGVNEWFTFDGPATTDEILRHCLTSSAQFQI